MVCVVSPAWDAHSRELCHRGADATMQTAHVVKVPRLYRHLSGQPVGFDVGHSQSPRTICVWSENAVKIRIDIRVALHVQHGNRATGQGLSRAAQWARPH